MTLLSTLAAIAGSAMAIGSIPQIHKIYSRKSAHDISAISYTIFTVGGIIWVLYGVEIGSFPVILTNALSAITNSIILVGWYTYRNKLKRRR